MTCWEVRHLQYRARIVKEGEAYSASVYDQGTEPGRRGVPCAVRGGLLTVREARRWVYERVGAAVVC